MSGPPFNYADLTVSLRLRGDGRDDNFICRPVSQQSFVAWAPPGALNPSSMMFRQRLSQSAGNKTIVPAGALATYAPWTATYVAVVPPVNSIISKTMKGVNGDVGVPLIPWLPNIIALPSPIPAGWQLIYSMGGAEDLDLYIF